MWPHSLVRVRASRRATPGRLARGGFLVGSGRFAFCPFDGGRLELSGVFGARELGFQFGNARRQDADLLCLHLDLCMLRQDDGDQLITGEREEGSVGHAAPE